MTKTARVGFFCFVGGFLGFFGGETLVDLWLFGGFVEVFLVGWFGFVFFVVVNVVLFYTF